MIGDAGGEEAVGARGVEGVQALDGAVEARCFVAVLGEEDVGAGVEDDWNAGVFCGCDYGSDGFELLGERDQFVTGHVFEIQADHAGFDEVSRGGGGVVIAGFDVGGYGHVDGGGDAADEEQHFGAGDLLAVGIAEYAGDTRAAGGDRGEAFGFDDAGADCVPGVGEHEDFGGVMQGAKLFGFRSLFFRFRSLIHRFYFIEAISIAPKMLNSRHGPG